MKKESMENIISKGFLHAMLVGMAHFLKPKEEQMNIYTVTVSKDSEDHFEADPVRSIEYVVCKNIGDIEKAFPGWIVENVSLLSNRVRVVKDA